VTEDVTRLAMLKRGEADVAYSLRGPLGEEVKRTAGLKLVPTVISATQWLDFGPLQWDPKSPWHDRRVRLAAALAFDKNAINKAETLGFSRPTGSIIPSAFEYALAIPPYPYDPAQAKKLLAEAGYPNGVDVLFNEGPPVVEPAIQQTNDAIIADMTKAGFRVKRNYIGDNTVLVARIKDGKAGPMFNWSWGYYSVFDADAILFDNFKCGENYSYYCNPALDDLIIQGRSTLDQKKRTDIYVKAQKLLFDDAAYLYKWGLRGVWGISNRIEYEAPRDEIDRMFLVTLRKK